MDAFPFFNAGLFKQIQATCTFHNNDTVEPASECSALLSRMKTQVGGYDLYNIYDQCKLAGDDADLIYGSDLGDSPNLPPLLTLESLLGNGTAMVIFLVLFDLVGEQELIWADLIRQLLQLIIGGIILGLLTGFILQMILSRLPINATIEVNTTIFATYLIFYTAEEILQASGILAVITMGLYFSAFSKNSISPESEESLH